MCEILFRGRRIDNKKWVYGDLFHGKDGLYIQYWENGEYRCYEVDPETVGQHTGLPDKNGVKIFEGDILSFKFEQIGEQEAIVEYSAKAHAFLMIPLNDFQFAMMCEGKVIGNIHDNQELFEGGQQCTDKLKQPLSRPL